MQSENKEHEWDDLIDAYLLDTINPEEKERLQSQMALDPELANRVRESVLAFAVIRHARERQLREKMERWDLGASRYKVRRKQWPLIFLLLLIFFLGGTLLTLIHFAPANVAERWFHRESPCPTHATSCLQQNRIWEKAWLAFSTRDYQTANQQFALYTLNADPEEWDAISWNLLLIRLAQEGPTIEWRTGLELYLEQAHQPFRTKAGKLKLMLDHPVYRYFIRKNKWPSTMFQPQII